MLLRSTGVVQSQQTAIAVKRLSDVMNAPQEPYALVPSREPIRCGHRAQGPELPLCDNQAGGGRHPPSAPPWPPATRYFGAGSTLSFTTITRSPTRIPAALSCSNWP